MNRSVLALLTVLAITAAVAVPVVATDRRVKAAAAAKCNMFTKYSSKTKTCEKR